MPVHFPPVEQADENGIIAIGGNLDVDTLTSAYLNGIFPWPIENLPLTWFAPETRGIIEFSKLHIPKSLKKFMNKTNFHVTFNCKFDEVIKMCAQIPRKGEKGTWINNEILQGYQSLFNRKLAYSVEVMNEDKLVGGMYGVCFGEIISGESMFHLEDNASKFAIIKLIELLKTSHITWLDTQMVTPVVGSLGGEEIPRSYYMEKLALLDSNRSRQKIFGN